MSRTRAFCEPCTKCGCSSEQETTSLPSLLLVRAPAAPRLFPLPLAVLLGVRLPAAAGPEPADPPAVAGGAPAARRGLYTARSALGRLLPLELIWAGLLVEEGWRALGLDGTLARPHPA